MHWANPHGGTPAGCFGPGRKIDLRHYSGPAQRDTFLLQFARSDSGGLFTFVWNPSDFGTYVSSARMVDVATHGVQVNVDMLQVSNWTMSLNVHEVYIISSARETANLPVTTTEGFVLIVAGLLICGSVIIYRRNRRIRIS